MQTTPTFRLLGLTFAFRGPQPLVDHLAWLFAGRETQDPAAVVYETRQPNGGDFEVWAVNRDVVAGAPNNLLLHDEAVLIDPRTGHVEPYPKPITLKADSWPLVPDLSPTVDRRSAAYFVGAWFVRPGDPPGVAPMIGVRTIVVMAASPDRAPGISRLTPGAGVLALADQCFRFSDGPLGQVATMDRVMRQASSWTLSHGSLADDVSALNDAWEQTSAPAAPSQQYRLPVATPFEGPVQLVAGVQHLVYAEDSVLVSANGRTLHALDAAATAILLAVLAGASVEQVAAHLAAVTGAPRVQVEVDGADLLDRLRAAELLRRDPLN